MYKLQIDNMAYAISRITFYQYHYSVSCDTFPFIQDALFTHSAVFKTQIQYQ